MITVLTPTFNRGYCLNHAYESLLRQTNNNFEWVVVDDGSADDTRQLVEKWKDENRFPVRYYHKENGGKHTALNLGIEKARGELVLILDSDDCLTPDAIETIIAQWKTVKHDVRVAGLHMLKGYKITGRCIGDEFPKECFLADSIKLRYYDGVRGDKAKIIRTEVLRRFPFPLIPGEHHVAPGVVWNRIAKEYMLLNVNRIIYLAEYLGDGISRNIATICWSNPRSSALSANERTTPEFPWKWRIRGVVWYITCSMTAHTPWRSIIREAKHPSLCAACLPFGVIWYAYQRVQHRKMLRKLKQA